MAEWDDRDTAAANDEDAVARLMRTAGRRADPPPLAYERTLAMATEAWHLKIRRRRQRRSLVAIAASLVLVTAGVLFVSSQPQQPAPIMGRTDRIIGTVEIQTVPGGRWLTLGDEPQGLSAGSHLRTLAGSRAGVVLAGGVSVRLADSTDVVLESSSRVRVLAGRMYVDTGRPDDARLIEVITAAGTASDLGTQFEVLYRDDVYRLRVREGRVLLSRESGEIDSDAGEQLTIDAGGAIERTRMTAENSEWHWVQSVAPAPDIDGQPLIVLLTWVMRETGKSVRFEKPEVERRASTTILHGNIRHLAPLEALSVMLATTDMEHVLLDDDTILVRLKVTR